MNPDKLAKLQQQVRIGGKGTARRKKKVVHRSSSTDDKKLQSSLKKLAVSNISGIEEVNMIKDDGSVIHFNNPKVQASLNANTFAVSGHAENKQITEMLPGILNHLGAEGFNQLKRLASSVNAAMGGSLGEQANVTSAGIDDDEDDVPELVEDFESASKSDTVGDKEGDDKHDRENCIQTDKDQVKSFVEGLLISTSEKEKLKLEEIETNDSDSKDESDSKDTEPEIKIKEVKAEVTETETDVKVRETETDEKIKEIETVVKVKETETDVKLKETETDVKVKETETDVKVKETETDVKVKETETDVKVKETETDVKVKETETDVKVKEIETEDKVKETETEAKPEEKESVTIEEVTQAAEE